MKPIVPAFILSEFIQIEQAPVGYGLSNTYRGVEIIPTPTFAERASAVQADGHPYRARLTRTTQTALPVIVRVLSSFGGANLAYWQDTFQQVSMARQQLQHAGAPRILHWLGEKNKPLATVEEYLAGTSVQSIVRALHARNDRMSEPMALAIGAGLLSLYAEAIRHEIPVLVGLDGMLIDAHGSVRIRPKYRDEESRQVVGAALLALNQNMAIASPEEIHGNVPDTLSAMFTFGLLLYELLAGVHPHMMENDSLFRTLTSIAEKPAPFLRSKRPDVHPVVASFVHRCLARKSEARFANWEDLRLAYVGMQSLFAPVLPDKLATLAKETVDDHERQMRPFVTFSGELSPFQPHTLHELEPSVVETKPPVARQPMVLAKPDVDPDAEFLGTDGRPMLRVAPTLLVDARPVTRGEMERYFFVTRQARPEVFGASNRVRDDDPCVLVSPEMAEAYASWAGKRLPTEAEWELAATTLGMERLDLGRVWEWTATEYPQGGRIVRGGRWRDQATMAPRLENRSFETNSAPDVGFRCVVSAWEESIPGTNGT